VGDVDARRGVVCLVAGLVEWVLVAGGFDSVRNDSREEEKREKGVGKKDFDV
jgi:hypothetical protein